MCTQTAIDIVAVRLVSIPFKRESTCAQDEYLTEILNARLRGMFQFPSNGKAHVHRSKGKI